MKPIFVTTSVFGVTLLNASHAGWCPTGSVVFAVAIAGIALGLYAMTRA